MANAAALAGYITFRLPRVGKRMGQRSRATLICGQESTRPALTP